jgi:hypothetical protein
MSKTSISPARDRPEKVERRSAAATAAEMWTARLFMRVEIQQTIT